MGEAAREIEGNRYRKYGFMYTGPGPLVYVARNPTLVVGIRYAINFYTARRFYRRNADDSYLYITLYTYTLWDKTSSVS